jgi:outer membrane protein
MGPTAQSRVTRQSSRLCPCHGSSAGATAAEAPRAARRSTRLATFAVLAAVLVPPAFAQEPAPGAPAALPKPEELRVPVDTEADANGAPIRFLTLEDVLRIGRAGNVRLHAAELLPEQARLDVVFAEAGFQPEVYGGASYSDSNAPTRTSDFAGTRIQSEQQILDARLGWRQRVATGGLFDLAYRPFRLDALRTTTTPAGTTESSAMELNSQWSASYRQPLLRGAWTDYTLAPVHSAQYGWNQSRATFTRAVQDTLLLVAQGYWELMFARENWRIVASALAVASEQLRITDERIRVGQLAPRNRVADEAEVARRREELITAENTIRSREDDLRRLLFDGQDATLWRVNLRPSSEIATTIVTEPLAFEPLVAVALVQRPDLRAQRSAVAAAELAELRADRDVLPALDLIGQYGSNAVRNEFGDAWRDSLDQDFPTWTVGLEFVLPIGNMAAKSRQQRAMLEVERQRRLVHALSLDIVRDVRDAARALHTLAQSIQASSESVRLAATNLETEQINLRVGASTAFEVQRRNQDLREARGRLLRNQLDYRIAESRLLHAQGLLDAPR